MKLSAAATGVLSGAACLTIASANTVCKDGVHVIVARDSEPQGFGSLKPVADSIVGEISDSDTVALEYPASVDRYSESQTQGVNNLAQLITSYADACPGHKIAVLGYSQGAHVVGDALIGTDYRKFASFRNRAGLDPEYVDAVCGVVLMGDPANVATQKFLVGSSTNSGSYPRNNTYNYYTSGLSSRLQSYCDAGDNTCDSGASTSVHKSYVKTYGEEAASFVVSQCKSYSPPTGNHKALRIQARSASAPISGSGSYPASHPPTGSYSVTTVRPTVSGSYTRPTTRPTASGSVPAPQPPQVSGNGTSGGNMTAPGNSTMTGTITETVPDVTPAPTSNGDQGIYTTRATPSPTGASANAASRLLGSSGVAGYVVTVVLGSALAMALNF